MKLLNKILINGVYNYHCKNIDSIRGSALEDNMRIED